MGNSKFAAGSMNANEKSCCDGGAETVNATYFRSLISGSSYTSHTRPYIVPSIGAVSKLSSCKIQASSILELKREFLTYVAGTIEHGIWYSKASNFRFCRFTDSD